MLPRVPGSGKSTLAFPLTELINELLGFPASEHFNVNKEQGLVSPEGSKSNGFVAASQRTAISVSLDGWHTTRADLDQMPVRRLRRALLRTELTRLMWVLEGPGGGSTQKSGCRPTYLRRAKALPSDRSMGSLNARVSGRGIHL